MSVFGPIRSRLRAVFTAGAATPTAAASLLIYEAERRVAEGSRYPEYTAEARRRLATRLSYFFWSSMPDDEPFREAEQGTLRRNLAAQVNRMLRDRAEGNEPDFQAFKDKWGQNFPGVESLDQLMEQMGKQMAQMQSLMESMTPGQRRELQ